ncbi:MAG: hypothetical protein HY563_00160 [Ignavibacteriales bacterium]|nr:hypothetical protein [Ignavibacteriales bacterium]
MFPGRLYSVSLLLLLGTAITIGQQPPPADTTIIFQPSSPDLVRPDAFDNPSKAWGFDIMISNNGFGAGGFLRHEFSDEISGILTLAISDVKDEAEVEYFDIFGNSVIPGKKNRLIMIPLVAAVQYRVFSEDIMDNFRPYISAGVGPTMMFVAPYAYTRTVSDTSGVTFRFIEEVEFFESLKYGQAKYTVGGYLSAGAYFGAPYGTLIGLSIRYYLVPFPQGIEIMEGVTVKNFGGFYITLNIGSFY